MNENLFEKSVVKSKVGSVISFEQSKVEIYHKALKEKIILMGDERKVFGMEADWAHFDFLLSTINFQDKKWDVKGERGGNSELTNYEALVIFWSEFWPYFKENLDRFQKTATAFFNMEAEADKVLQNHARQNLELKIYQEFMERMDDSIKYEFQKYKEKRQSEIDEAIKDIQEREEKKLAKKAGKK